MISVMLIFKRHELSHADLTGNMMFVMVQRLELPFFMLIDVVRCPELPLSSTVLRAVVKCPELTFTAKMLAQERLND